VLYFVYYTFSSIEEESEVHVFIKYKFEETVGTRRLPELEIIITV